MRINLERKPLPPVPPTLKGYAFSWPSPNTVAKVVAVFALFSLGILYYLYHSKAPSPPPKKPPPTLPMRSPIQFSWRAATPASSSTAASTPSSVIFRRWALMGPPPALDLSIDSELSTDTSTNYEGLQQWGTNLLMNAAPKELHEKISNRDLLVLNLGDEDSLELNWDEVLIARGYFEKILTSTPDDRVSLLSEDQPLFYGHPILSLFRELSPYFQSEEPFAQFVFKELLINFYKVQHTLVNDPTLFSLAYPDVELIDVSLDTSLSLPSTPATPMTPTKRVPISPQEDEALHWAQNPVIQWLIYQLVVSEPDWDAFIKFSTEPYLANFQKMALFLYLRSHVATNLLDDEVEKLRHEALSHLTVLRNTLVKLKECDLQSKLDTLDSREKSHLFESYLFYNVLDKIVPQTLHNLAPDWQTHASQILNNLKNANISLQPRFSPSYPPLTPLSSSRADSIL